MHGWSIANKQWTCVAFDNAGSLVSERLDASLGGTDLDWMMGHGDLVDGYTIADFVRCWNET